MGPCVPTKIDIKEGACVHRGGSRNVTWHQLVGILGEEAGISNCPHKSRRVAVDVGPCFRLIGIRRLID